MNERTPLSGRELLRPLPDDAAARLLGLEGPASHRILACTEGLPALIEAARSRLEVVGAAELADRLEQGLEVLGTALQPIHDARAALPERERAVLQGLGWLRGPFELDVLEALADLDTLQALVVAGWLRTVEPGRLPGETWYRVPHFARIEASVPAAWTTRLEELLEQRPLPMERLATYGVDLERGFEALLAQGEPAARTVGMAWARVLRNQGPSAVRQRVLVQLHRRFPEDAEVYLGAMDARALPADEARLEALSAGPEHAQAAARCLSRVLLQRGADDEALAWAERAVAHDPDDVRSQCALAEVLTRVGRTGDAEVAYRSALASARRNEDRTAEAAVAGFLGMLYGERAEDAAARDQLAHAAQLLEGLGDPFGAALYRMLLGELALADGDGAEARASFGRALETLEPRGAARWIPWCHIGSLLAGVLAGEHDEEALQQALVAGRLVEDPNVRALVVAGAAAAMLAAGEEAPALLAELEHTGSHLVPELVAALQAVARSTPDPRASTWTTHTRAIARLAGRPAERPPDLRCCVDLSWFEPHGGQRVPLETRTHNRRVLAALVEAWRRGTTIDVDGLLEVAWPGERVLPEAGSARVYTAIATLRRQGLAPFIVKLPDGYTLAPSMRIQFVEATA